MVHGDEPALQAHRRWLDVQATRSRARAGSPIKVLISASRTTGSSELHSILLACAIPDTSRPSAARRAPGDEAEPQAIIDHRKSAGGKVQALAVDARDGLALGGRVIWQAGVRSDSCCGRLELAPAQRVEEIAREDDALTLTLARPCPTRYSTRASMARGPRGRSRRLESDAAHARGAAGRAKWRRRLDLRLHRQIGAHRKGDALPAGGILKAAQLDDAPGAARSPRPGRPGGHGERGRPRRRSPRRPCP